MLDAALIKAYRETDYHVCSTPAFVLHVDHRSEALRALLARNRVKGAAFVTACNPRSQPLGDADNEARQRRLLDQLALRGLPTVPGVARHPGNGWPQEVSVLVLGVTLDDARELGIRCDQNAVLWAGTDAVPRLILLR